MTDIVNFIRSKTKAFRIKTIKCSYLFLYYQIIGTKKIFPRVEGRRKIKINLNTKQQHKYPRKRSQHRNNELQRTLTFEEDFAHHGL